MNPPLPTWDLALNNMLVTVDGIVIGRRNIGENNCFLDILTKEYGVIEVIAHGANKINSKNAGSTALFSYATFCMNKSGLKYTINSTQPKYSFHKLSYELEKLSLAAYFAEVLRYTSASEQSEEDILRFFAITLFELEKSKRPNGLIKAVFELRLAGILGFLPDLRACSQCGCYENEMMYFSFADSSIICKDCLTEELCSEDDFPLSPSLLYTLRYVTYSPLDKIYGFELKEETLLQFSEFSEKYLLKHLDRGFKSLDYYKGLLIK